MTRNFRRIALMICFSVSYTSSAQNFSYSDFLNETDLARKFELGLEGAYFYRNNNLDSLRIFATQFALGTAQNKFSNQNFALSRRYLGSYFIRTTNIKKGIRYLEEAKQQFTQLDLKILVSETENELGNAYYLLGDYNQATIHYLASIENGIETSDRTAEYNGMIGFGKATCADGDTATGLLFVQKYLERALKDKKFEAASDACGFLGMIAGQRGRINLMSSYYNRGILYAKKSDSKTHQANALNNKAIDYYYREKADSSAFFFKQTLTIREEIGNARPIVESLYNLAIFYIERGDFDLAREYAESGELLANKTQMRSSQIECLILLVEIANKTEKFSEISKLKLEIARIQSELKKLGAVDDRIIQTALKHASPKVQEKQFDSYWELVAVIALILTAVILLYYESASSISGGIRA